MKWDSRDYIAGLDRGVFYLDNRPGEPWNGLTAVTEDLTGGTDEQVRYIDGVKTNSRRRRGDFSGTIEAFTYPDSFFDNVLVRRRPSRFGLSYRTGNEIHIVYNVLIAPESIQMRQQETDVFQWSFTTLPIPVPDARSCSHFIVDVREAYQSTIEDLEGILYGTDSLSARLPLPDEILEIFEAHSILRVIDNGDGTATITGPDDAVQALDATTYQITWQSVVQIDAVTYKISSL